MLCVSAVLFCLSLCKSVTQRNPKETLAVQEQTPDRAANAKDHGDRWPLEQLKQRRRGREGGGGGSGGAHKVKVCAAAGLPLGAGGELGSRLAGDFGLFLFGLGLIPLLRARLLWRRRLPLLRVRAAPAGVGAVVRPRLHLTGHPDTEQEGKERQKGCRVVVFPVNKPHHTSAVDAKRMQEWNSDYNRNAS